MGSVMAAKQASTESSESTSRRRIWMGRFSMAAVWASSSAVAKPMPELEPVTRTVDRIQEFIGSGLSKT